MAERDDRSPRDRFAAALDELILLSGRTNKDVAARANQLGRDNRIKGTFSPINERRVSEWRNGSSVPASWSRLVAVVSAATESARGRAPARHDLYDLANWRTWHTEAATAAGPTTRHRSIRRWNPLDLDVHRAMTVTAPGRMPELPGYLRRPHDDEIDTLLADTGRGNVLIVLTGGSSTGKTRAMYEAISRHDQLSAWPLHYPRTGEELAALVDGGLDAAGTVLWLNELQRHLLGETGARSAALISRLLDGSAPGPIVAIASMWPPYWEAVTAEPRPEEDPHVQGRQLLLHRAARVRVPEGLTPDQLQSLAESPEADPRLLSAVAAAGPARKVIQVLAGGPVLVDRYEHPDHDRARFATAILTAAIDIQRLGHPGPIPASLLTAAAPGYLDPALLDDPAPPDWAQFGLLAATTAVHGVRALSPNQQPPVDYTLHDYLDQHGRRSRSLAPIPTEVWDALVDHTTDPLRCWELGHQAGNALRYRHAEAFYRRGTQEVLRRRDSFDDASVVTSWGEFLARLGRWDELTHLVKTVEVPVHNLVFVLGKLDRPAELKVLLDHGHPEARHYLADHFAREGKVAELEDLDPLEHSDVEQALMDLLYQQGRLDDIKKWVVAGSFLAPSRLADLLVDRDQLDELKIRAAAGDEDADWRLIRTLQERQRWDQLEELAAAGNRHAARIVDSRRTDLSDEPTLQALSAAGNPSARDQLARRLAEEERTDELRALAAAGSHGAKYLLIELLNRQGRVDELWALMDDSRFGFFHGTVQHHRAKLLAAQDRVDDLRNLAADGDGVALSELSDLFGRGGRVDELRALADANIWGMRELATNRLVDVLAERQDVPSLRGMADNGNDGAAGALVKVLLDRRSTEDLRAFLADYETDLRRRSRAGHRRAPETLADLLAAQARETDLRELAKAGIERAADRLADGLNRDEAGRDELVLLAAVGNYRAQHILDGPEPPELGPWAYAALEGYGAAPR